MAELSVASAAFFRLECSHDELFQPEYKRSNRTKGLKILRCFPHCCPAHIDRSYCGSSLSVRVELETPKQNAEVTTSSLSESVVLFARFEALNDVSLKPGEYVEVDRMETATQSERNPDAQWIPGVLDSPSKMITPIHTPGTPKEEQKSMVYHLNTKTNIRWYYDWESGANKAQRLMKHVLKAYIAERFAQDKNDKIVAFNSPQAHKQLYRIMHVVTSPEFTVISYRRAAPENQATLLSSHDTPPYLMQENVLPENTNVGLRFPKGTDESGHSHSPTKRPHLHPPMEAPVYREEYKLKRQQTSTSNSFPAFDLLEDKLRWEYANLSTVAVSRNLALVYSFLRWAPLNAYATFADELVHLLNNNLKEAYAGFSHVVSKLNCFSKLIFGQVDADGGVVVASSFIHSNYTAGGAPAELPERMKRLLYVLIQVTLWFFSLDTRHWMHAFFHDHAESVLDKYSLRASFVLFIRQLEERLNADVLCHSAFGSLENVAEEIIAAVYSYEYFHPRRPQVREILSGQNFAGWNAFVAQMRQVHITVSTFPRHSVPPRNSVERFWNAPWFLEVDDAVWRFNEEVRDASIGHVDGWRDTISLFSLFEIVSLITRLDVAINVQALTLQIRSCLGVAGPLGCLRVVLDGKARVFTQFSNGMTSGIDMGAHGDYIAELDVENSERLVVYLQIFQWSVRQDGPSHHVRMRIECNCNRLCISGDVLVTTAPASFDSDDIPILGEMSLHSKREAVEKAFAQQLQEGSTTRSTPWRELGRFRLNYLKFEHETYQ
ncbi:hypothetical protein F444_08197 [Phytophthora nicotianae P1976]|uniref:Uncharacterized protein n=2 Tax=Phytophthora nicotianae P1976 TaxID=1317066 RepID=A0A081ABX9_PHYNI|nr:hypothetical protein F444_08197 [Phytophthora nicotianae P1976]